MFYLKQPPSTHPQGQTEILLLRAFKQKRNKKALRNDLVLLTSLAFLPKSFYMYCLSVILVSRLLFLVKIIFFFLQMCES